MVQKRIWKAKVLPNKMEEYIQRHNYIWSEMVVALQESGISNYSIWRHGDLLIGYYECLDLAIAEAFKRESAVMKRWEESMQGVMELVIDEKTGNPIDFDLIFELL